MGDFYRRPIPIRDTLDTVLRRRGHVILRAGDTSKTAFWNAATNRTLLAMGQFNYVRYFGNDPLGVYMAHFGRFSFRQLISKLMAAGDRGLTIEAIQEIVRDHAAGDLQLLENLQTIAWNNDVVRWHKSGDNIGASLEHFVAMLCERELGASAVEWNVAIDGIHEGGEFDVIASLDPTVIHIECKSSIRNIDDGHLRQFLRRNEELAPDLSVLLIDTSGSVEKIANRLNADIERLGMPTDSFERVEEYGELYHGNSQSYLINNAPSIVRKLRECLIHYHRTVKPTGMHSFIPNFFRSLPLQPGFGEEDPTAVSDQDEPGELAPKAVE